MGRVPNPLLKDLVLPTETYFKLDFKHYKKPIRIMCEIQKKIQILYGGGGKPAVDLAKRLSSAGLYHGDTSDYAGRQMGIPDGENYAVYVDLGGLGGTLK